MISLFRQMGKTRPYSGPPSDANLEIQLFSQPFMQPPQHLTTFSTILDHHHEHIQLNLCPPMLLSQHPTIHSIPLCSLWRTPLLSTNLCYLYNATFTSTTELPNIQCSQPTPSPTSPSTGQPHPHRQAVIQASPSLLLYLSSSPPPLITGNKAR